MEFSYSNKVKRLEEQLQAFMDAHIYPNEAVYEAQLAANRWQQPAIPAARATSSMASPPITS